MCVKTAQQSILECCALTAHALLLSFTHDFRIIFARLSLEEGHNDLQTGAGMWMYYIQIAILLGKEKPECEPQHWIPDGPYWLTGSSLPGFVSARSSYGWPRQTWYRFMPCCVDLSSGTETVVAIWLWDEASVHGPPLFSSIETQAACGFLFARPATVIWENWAQPWNSRNDLWIWYRETDLYLLTWCSRSTWEKYKQALISQVKDNYKSLWHTA